MQFTEAFERLGYSVEVPRQDWSAEKATGVCISLWRREMGVRDGLLWMNTRVHADPLEGWESKPGNRKRIRGLRRALDEFEGRVDVVIVSGEPGDSYGTARPWISNGARAGTHWMVGAFDEQTGHFEARLVQLWSSLSVASMSASVARASGVLNPNTGSPGRDALRVEPLFSDE